MCKVCIRKCTFVEHEKNAVMSSGADVLMDGCHSSLNVKGAYHLLLCGPMQVVRCSSDRDVCGVSAYQQPFGDPGESGGEPCLIVQEVLGRGAKFSASFLDRCN